MKRSSKAVKYFLIVFVIFIACPAYAANYYVDPGGDDGNDGSIGTPFATITQAVSVAVAGDTIYLRGGQHDYSSTISIATSGTSSDYITLQAYQDEVPVLDYTAQPYGTSSRGILVTGNYWHLKGFIIQNAGDNGLNLGGNYNIAEQIVARMNRDSGIQFGGAGASYNLILNCDSYLNYDAPNHGENADGFASKSSDIGPGNVFRGCRAWNNADDGFDLYYTQIAITFEDCWAWGNGVNRWGDSSWNGDGNGYKLGSSAGNHVLIRCMAYDQYHNGIDINGDTLPVEVYNCTVYDCGTNYYFDEHIASVLRNNISYVGGENLYAEVDDQYNSWNSGFSVSSSDFVSLDPTGIDGPRQPDGSLPDLDFLKLVETSSLIDAGIDVGEPYNGSAPDLGAFEWSEPSTDTTPPTPDPMTFATPPYAVSSTSISMVATTATDTENGVEYRFICTAGGGHSSNWQSGTSYTDTGLTPSTMYTYTVTARDTSSNHNETAASGAASATTDADTTAPTPDPMTFSTLPYAASSSTITMIASVATDDAYGVEYRFICTAGGGNSSGWQSSRIYTDTGLTPDTMYTYTVTARDLSPANNETSPSSPASATTNPDTTAPDAPTGLTATVGYEVIELDWDENSEPDLAGYNVYRWTNSDANQVKLNSSLLANPYYDDNDVDYDTAYFYVVTAVDIYSNESLQSTQVSAALQIYGDFVVNGVVDVYDLDYFCQLWLVDDCNATDGVDLNDDCVVDNYELSVFANNWRAIQPDTTPPGAPTGLSATAGDATVSLDWDDNGEADLAGYDIYRSVTSGSGYVQQNSSLLTSSDYTDNTVVNGVTYYYVVLAVDMSDNESDYSAQVSATPAAPVTNILIQEYEAGYCDVDGSIDTDHAGYTGDGFFNTDNVIGTGIDWSVEIITGGSYTFAWRYAHGKTDDRSARLLVNGSEVISSITFPPTADFDTWETVSVGVSLTAGVKTIRLEGITSNSLANIDYIEITGPNLITASCP
ncbi:MAG: carbohydrate-binding protein [Sedimentisphaerales bacterium]|nr:carbohydrate-binding protein [Sedimentisphaerales bacterium]